MLLVAGGGALLGGSVVIAAMLGPFPGAPAATAGFLLTALSAVLTTVVASRRRRVLGFSILSVFAVSLVGVVVGLRDLVTYGSLFDIALVGIGVTAVVLSMIGGLILSLRLRIVPIHATVAVIAAIGLFIVSNSVGVDLRVSGIGYGAAWVWWGFEVLRASS
jgi:hypothetical protein